MLILGALTIIAGTGNIATLNNKEELSKVKKEKISAYNYNPSNILDNVFTYDNLNILPFIYKNSDETISKEYVIGQIQAAGQTVVNISTDTIKTGTIITTNQKTYTVLIYGDADGDGYVDVFDAQAIVYHYIYEGDYTLRGVNFLAANTDNEDNEVDVFDAQRIVEFYIGKIDNVVVNAPISDKEIDNEKPVINLNGEDPQTIKLGQAYVELGATVTDNVDQNVSVQIDASNVNTNVVGTYIVKYNATDCNGNKADEVTRTVKVVDYIQSITLESVPTKTVYILGENLDLTGAKLKVVYASGHTTVDITEQMVSGFDINKKGTQVITVSYEGKTFTFDITVVNYVTGIEIAQNPIKLDYIENETISLDGIKVNKVMVNGSREEITDTRLLTINPTTATYGQNIIKVQYQTDNTVDEQTNTFEAQFDILVYKEANTINITELNLEGERYNKFDIAELKSGDGEEQISEANLSWELTYETDTTINANTIAEVTVTELQLNENQVRLSFNATKAGVYKIIPKVGDKTGNPIIVTVGESTVVTDISIEDTYDVESKFRVNQYRTYNLEFKHTYPNREVIDLEVPVSKLQIAVSEGLEYQLLDKDGNDITNYETSIVKSIGIKAIQEENQKLSIKVDNAEVEKTFEILEELIKVIDINGMETITLYYEMPTDVTDVRQDDGLIYTLIPISLKDQEGTVTKLKVGDMNYIKSPTTTVEGVNIYDSAESIRISCIDVNCYKVIDSQITKVTGAEEEIDYIGIALGWEGAENYLLNQKIIITSEKSTKEIDIEIPLKEISNVYVDTDNFNSTGERFKAFDIAELRSGDAEKDITISDVTCNIEYITDNSINGNSIAEVDVLNANQMSGNDVKLSFIATKAGTYKITPTVAGVEITAITVTIEESNTVTSIAIQDPQTGNDITNLPLNEVKNARLVFKHEYPNGEAINLDVQASRVSVSVTNGLQYYLLDKDDNELSTRPASNVYLISLKATQVGEYTLTIMVDNDEETKLVKEIEVLGEQTKIVQLGDSRTSIKLYTTMTLAENDNTEITKLQTDDGANPYTLIPISLEDGKIIAGDLNDDKETTSGKINILDSTSYPIQLVTIKAYKIDGENIVEATSEDEIDYVGIALVDSSVASLLEGAKIQISSDDMVTPISLDIVIVSE